MKRFLLSASTLFVTLLSTIVVAEEAYTCVYGGSERVIKVEYQNPDSKVPCSVVYEKDTGRQVLWEAQNVQGYCEIKTKEFIEKQRAWGWDCTEMTEVKAAD